MEAIKIIRKNKDARFIPVLEEPDFYLDCRKCSAEFNSIVNEIANNDFFKNKVFGFIYNQTVNGFNCGEEFDLPKEKLDERKLGFYAKIPTII